MRMLLFAILTLAPAALAGQRPGPTPPAQPGPPSDSRLRSKEVAITVEGCVQGRQLLPLRLPVGGYGELLNVSAYQLEGSKEILRQLGDEHRGHQEAITGIAILPPTPGGEVVDTRSRAIGKVKVTGGVRETGSTNNLPTEVTPADSPRPIRLKVQSATHVAETCLPRN